MSKLETDRHSELAHFLRNRRERITPGQAGLPETSRRRTPGLRRGEVAMLAGVSLEWYTYLEQGRLIQVSADLLENLSKVLQLDAAERRHLFLLARQQEPPERQRIQTTVTPELQRLIDALGTSPGCIIDVRMNVVAWNASFRAVFGELENKSDRERNMLWVTFESTEFRKLKGDEWEDHARRTIAQFHAGYARFVDDPWWAAQIDALSENSSEFKMFWDLHDVLNAPDTSKIIHHPKVGILAFDYISLLPPNATDLQVSIHVPHDDGKTSEKIKQLMMDNKIV
jgi:transcriptional regulator with XRE-family HTH domain